MAQGSNASDPDVNSDGPPKVTGGKDIELSHANYAKSWEPREAFRELVQNWYVIANQPIPFRSIYTISANFISPSSVHFSLLLLVYFLDWRISNLPGMQARWNHQVL